MILRQKYFIDELEYVPCPKDVHPIVWGNPHEKTGKKIEKYRRIMSKEAWTKKLAALEERWLAQVKEHEAFMGKQRQLASEAKSTEELLAEGCYIDPTDTDEWFY